MTITSKKLWYHITISIITLANAKTLTITMTKSYYIIFINQLNNNKNQVIVFMFSIDQTWKTYEKINRQVFSLVQWY